MLQIHPNDLHVVWQGDPSQIYSSAFGQVCSEGTPCFYIKKNKFVFISKLNNLGNEKKLHFLSWHDTATTHNNTPNMDTKILVAVILHEN